MAPQKPLARAIGTYLEVALADEVDRVCIARGITKREFFELAVRRELQDPTFVKPSPTQEELAIGA